MRISDWSSDVCSSDLTAASSGTGDVVQVRRRSNASCPAPARAQPQETCMFLSVVSIGTGAALGAWLRWGLGLWLNPHHATLPLGTLAANLVGGYGVGLALGWFAQTPGLSPERSEEHTSELQSLMRISYAVFCLKKKIITFI